MADHSSPKRLPADPSDSEHPLEDRANAPNAPEEQNDHWDMDEEPGTDPEHARRLAAVRTELLRRSMPKREPEE